MKATDIAEYILYKCKEKNIEISPLKLMKLAYLGYGWYTKFFNKRLFDDSIQAWKYGPVIPQIYQEYKSYKSNPIEKNLDENTIFQVENALKNDIVIDGEVKGSASEFIDAIIEQYGKLSAITLSTITHEKGSPWSIVYDGTRHNEIPFDIIQDYYNKNKF